MFTRPQISDTATVRNLLWDAKIQFILRSIRTVFGMRSVRVLDVGCGTGKITIPVANCGHRVTAVDIDQSCCRHLLELVRQRGITSVSVLCADITELHMECCFDVVIAADVLEHIPISPIKVLERLRGLTSST